MSIVRGGAYGAVTAAVWIVRPGVRLEIFDEFPPIPPHSETDIAVRLVLAEPDTFVDGRAVRRLRPLIDPMGPRS